MTDSQQVWQYLMYLEASYISGNGGSESASRHLTRCGHISTWMKLTVVGSIPKPRAVQTVIPTGPCLRILNRITHDLRPNYIPTLNPSPNPSPSPSPRPQLQHTLHTMFTSIHSSPNIGNSFQKIPLSLPSSLPQLRTATGETSLSCSLVRAALPGPSPPQYKVAPITINTIVSRITKCTSPHCKACPYALGRCILYSTVSRTPYTFSLAQIHLCILCSKCDKMYIGLTSQSIRQRFNAHRYAAKRKLRIPLYRHSSRRSHDFDRDHRIVPLEHCEPDALAEREQYWIRTINTKLPHGLNSVFSKPYYPQSLTSLPLPPESSLHSSQPPSPNSVPPQHHLTSAYLPTAPSSPSLQP